MKLFETEKTNRRGLIVAVIVENGNVSPTNDPNKSYAEGNDPAERQHEENDTSNPDPKVDDPNTLPKEDNEGGGLSEEHLKDRKIRRRDDLIDPIDPLNSFPGEDDPDQDDEDPLELPEQDDNDWDAIEPDDEVPVPVKEKDDLDQNRPREFPEEDNDENLNTAEGDYLHEKDFDRDDRDLEVAGLESEDNHGNFM